jgi:hypothetical protein
MAKSASEIIDATERVRVLNEIFSEEEADELGDRFDVCAHGRKLRCDECASRDWDEGRKEGFDLGFNWVITEIEKRAGEAFVKGKDSTASGLRDLVTEVKALAIKEKVWIKENR